MPEIFLPGSIALERCRVRVLHTLRVHDQERWTGAAPQFQTGRTNLDFLKPSPKALIPCWSGSLHLAKYECTVRHLGKSLGRNLHWQPVRSRYSTAQNTSCRSTAWGLVRRRTLQQQEVNLFKLLTADVAGVCLSRCTIFGAKGRIVNTLLASKKRFGQCMTAAANQGGEPRAVQGFPRYQAWSAMLSMGISPRVSP